MKVDTLGRGVLLPELKLALDTSAPGYESICSHAHGDHVPWDAQHAYATPETCDLLAIRAPFLRTTPVPWRERTPIGGAHVTFLPAGHILGSALTLVEAPDGATLLYTADTKTRPSLTTPLAEFPEADELIVESTFGLPIYRFPEYAELGERMATWARSVLAEGAVPVFLGYALGKSQEICAILQSHGVPVVAHGAVWNVCQVYERHGVHFPGVVRYSGGKPLRGVSPQTPLPQALVVPDTFREHPMVLKRDHRLAYCSGWALLSKSRTQMDADALFPLSDHADFPGLLEIVKLVRPKRVYTNHGYADVLAHLLNEEGIPAAALHVGHAEEDAGPAGAQTTLEDQP